MSSTFNITVVVDDHIAKEGLLEEHGFSLFVTTPHGNLLLDSGQGQSLETNAKSLGIDLSALDTVVLSHGHYDHSGGLACIPLERGIPLFMHPKALTQRYRKCESYPHKPIGMPEAVKNFLRYSPVNVRYTNAPTLILRGAWATGPIPRVNPCEDTGGPFFVDEACTEPDLIEDDQAIWLESSEGPIVLLGCAHAGVVNTLEYIACLTGQPRIHAVIGGMHLQDADEKRLSETVRGLKRYQVGLIAPCHCSGSFAITCIRESLPRAVVSCGGGSVFAFTC